MEDLDHSPIYKQVINTKRNKSHWTVYKILAVRCIWHRVIIQMALSSKDIKSRKLQKREREGNCHRPNSWTSGQAQPLSQVFLSFTKALNSQPIKSLNNSFQTSTCLLILPYSHSSFNKPSFTLQGHMSFSTSIQYCSVYLILYIRESHGAGLQAGSRVWSHNIWFAGLPIGLEI